jgi:hypothetical protein
MLSGDAAEREDSSDERVEGQSPLIQPPGAQSPLIQPYGKQSSSFQPHGALSPSSQPQGAMASPVPASDPMPVFTGQHPGTVRTLPPRKGNKVTSVSTKSPDNETTLLAQTTTHGERVISSESASEETTRQVASHLPSSIYCCCTHTRHRVL